MTGRRDLEARLRCPRCHGVPYHLVRRQIGDGPVGVHEVVPTHPNLPDAAGQPTCPDCQVPCRWEAAR